ncbi:hypothetical protein Taro_029286 [Colocasia esculenta]|uniref:Uncharacterized protein n=1 Tax=Colocasia esculenta TaxID=4460 RepID=A0A843VWR8_COLES|nr:hypothetical protein [Colocasia esculenta]
MTGLHGSVDTGSSSVDTRSSSQKTCLAVLDSNPRKSRAQSFLEKGKKSGKEESTSRGAEQRRQGEKKEKKRRSSRLQECWSRRRSSQVCNRVEEVPQVVPEVLEPTALHWHSPSAPPHEPGH